MAQPHKETGQFGRPPDHSDGYEELHEIAHSWNEAFEVVRQYSRRGRFRLFRIGSIHNALNRQFEIPGRIGRNSIALTQSRLAATYPQAKEFRFFACPLPQDQDTQTLVLCINVFWLAEGEDIGTLRDALKAYE